MTWELKFANGAPPVAEISKALDRWAANVEQMTNGQVKTTLYHGGTLLGSRETYRGVQEGVADASYFPLTLANLDETNLTNIMALPFMGFPSQRAGSEIFRALLKEFPEIEAGLPDIKLTYGSCIMPQQLHTTKKLVKVPDDLSGMKVLAGNWFADGLASVGAAGVQQPPTEWYMSLERGLAEANIDGWTGVENWKTSELFKYHTEFGDGGAVVPTICLLMNLDTWNSFPQDIQDKIYEASQILDDERQGFDLDITDSIRQWSLDDGQEIYVTTPAELQKWEDVFQPKQEEWISKAEAAGLPAQAVYDAAKRMIAEWND